jgi:hypothetical protein
MQDRRDGIQRNDRQGDNLPTDATTNLEIATYARQ